MHLIILFSFDRSRKVKCIGFLIIDSKKICRQSTPCAHGPGYPVLTTWVFTFTCRDRGIVNKSAPGQRCCMTGVKNTLLMSPNETVN